MNSKKKGDIGLGEAIAYFTSKGLTVSVPLTDSQDYDLIVEFDGILKRVQVKYTSHKNDYGNYEVSLTVKGGNRSSLKNSVKKPDFSRIDLYFVLCYNRNRYLIDTKGIKNRTSFTFGKDYDKYLV